MKRMAGDDDIGRCVSDSLTEATRDGVGGELGDRNGGMKGGRDDRRWGRLELGDTNRVMKGGREEGRKGGEKMG
jgi:hypothetical protein